MLSRIRRGKSERGRLSSQTRAKREPFNYVESFDNAAIRHNTILYCEETLADSKYSDSALVGELLFSGSVETLRKRFGLLVYCLACDDRKVIVKKQKYCSTANHVLCMPEIIRGQVS